MLYESTSRCPLLLIILVCFASWSTGALAGEKILLETSFEKGGSTPAGWAAKGGAQWTEFARTGNRSLEVRSWQTDEVMHRVEDEYIRQTLSDDKQVAQNAKKLISVDPHHTWWIGPPIQIGDDPVKVSFWGANNITYMNDESFRAEVALVKCPADGSMPNIEHGKTKFHSAEPLHFYRAQRENYQHYARAVPEGLRWQYREAVLNPEKGTYRVLMHFRKEPDGQAWMDDLKITTSSEYRTEQQLLVEAGQKQSNLPWELQVNFPVSFNLFKVGDPLQMDLAIVDADGLPKVTNNTKLVYEIRDFNYRYVHGGAINLKPGDYPVWHTTAYLKKMRKSGYLKYVAAEGHRLDGHTIIVPTELPETLKAYEGQMLIIKATLEQNNKKMAQDEVAFGIITPAKPDKANLWRGGKTVEQWGPRPDLPADLGDASDHNGLYYKMGGQWNSVPIELRSWPKAWPKKDGPINVGETPKKVYPHHGYLFENYMNMSFRNYPGSTVPKWARLESQDVIDHYGYWVFDLEAYSKLSVAYVQRMLEVFPNAVAICPTAGEQPFDQWRYDAQKATYAAIKKAHPSAKVGAWYWAHDFSVVDHYENAFDFLDTENYSDPRMPGQGGVEIAKRYSEQLGRPIFATILEGCARVGSEEQEESARGVFDFHIFNWMRGEKFLGQFEFDLAYTKPDGSPLLRDAIIAQWGETGHMSGARRLKLTRYDMVDGKNTREGSLGYSYGPYPTYFPTYIQPALPTMALAQTIRFLDSAEFQRPFRVPDVYAFQFERLGKTFIYLEAHGMEDLHVKLTGTTAAFQTLDIYGYRHRVEPADDGVVLTIGHYPLILLFDELLDKDAARIQRVNDVTIGMTRPIVKLSPSDVHVNLGSRRGSKLHIDLDQRMSAPKAVPVKPGQTASIRVTPKEERPTGAYRTYVRVTDGGKTTGLLSLPLKFQSAGVRAKLAGQPVTHNLDPAVRVELDNFTSKPAKVRLRFRDDYTVNTVRPTTIEKTQTVPANQTLHVDFPLQRDRLRVNFDYPYEVEMTQADGSTQTIKGDVYFRGVPKIDHTVQIDGKLNDWPLDKLLSVKPLTRMMIGGRTGGVARGYYSTWQKDLRPDGKFDTYFAWKDDGLYAAFVVNNPNPDRPIENPAEHYAQDCWYFTFYPERYEAGEGTIMKPFKIHLSMDKTGNPTLVDGNGKVRTQEELGIKYAATETSTGYVYEMFMSQKYLRQLKLEPGSQFSASFVGFHKHYGSPMGTKPPLYGFMRGTFTFDGGLQNMGRFVLTK